MSHNVTFRIILEKPPPGVDFGLQEGSGNNYITIQKQRSHSEDLHFEFTVRVKESKASMPDFNGPVVQGRKNERFVYLDIGTYAGQVNSAWSRRLKIPLSGITLEMIDQSITEPNIIFETHVAGTAKDGGPTCGTIKPFGSWKLLRVSRH